MSLSCSDYCTNMLYFIMHVVPMINFTTVVMLSIITLYAVILGVVMLSVMEPS